MVIVDIVIVIVIVIVNLLFAYLGSQPQYNDVLNFWC